VTELLSAIGGGARWKDDVSQTGNALQAVRPIEVGKHGAAPFSRQKAHCCGIADQRENAVMAKQTGKHAASDVTAADDQ
jgi:hypothetical protein